ncbi:MAG: hypothetical protein WBZ08_20605, partial [Pseudolabrys sp.]
VVKTIGIVEVAAFAASPEGLSVATRTDTCRRTRSAARICNLSWCPSAKTVLDQDILPDYEASIR